MNNEFLGLVHVDAQRYIEECFCATCRNLRFVSYTQYSVGELHRLFERTLPLEQDGHLLAYHRSVLEQIAAGKTFKELALRNSHYTYLRVWVKNHLPWSTWEVKKRNSFVDRINAACIVYDGWDVITSNLMDARMTEIDARKFGIRLFQHAE